MICFCEQSYYLLCTTWTCHCRFSAAHRKYVWVQWDGFKRRDLPSTPLFLPVPSLLPAKFHFQISHQRLVLRKLGLIANKIKRIPITSKTNPRTLILCVFIIVVNCPSYDHASQTPTIANTALRIGFMFTPSITRLILDDLTEKVLIYRLVISRIATSLSFLASS
jgi:hypothetical protein